MSPVNGTVHIRQLPKRTGKMAQFPQKAGNGARPNTPAGAIMSRYTFGSLAVPLFLYTSGYVGTHLRCFARKCNDLTAFAKRLFFSLPKQVVFIRIALMLPGSNKIDNAMPNGPWALSASWASKPRHHGSDGSFSRNRLIAAYSRKFNGNSKEIATERCWNF